VPAGIFADADLPREGLRRMRACAIDVMSLPSAQPAVPIPGEGAAGRRAGIFDHDFVI